MPQTGIPSAETDWGRQGAGHLLQRKGSVNDVRQGSSEVSSVISCYGLVACLQGKAWTEARVEKGQQDGQGTESIDMKGLEELSSWPSNTTSSKEYDSSL